MKRFDRWLMYLSNGLVGGTGIIYLGIQYLLKPVDEFSLVHPAQPHAQHLHIILAPLLVLAFGHLAISHGWIYRQSPGIREGRKSGTLMLVIGLPMIFSGYGIQIVTESMWRSIWIWVHLATGVIWLLGLAVHWWAHRSRAL